MNSIEMEFLNIYVGMLIFFLFIMITASCPVVDSIKNGIITHATLKEGGVVEIACRTNFTLVGSAKLSCIKGKWSDNLPSCKGLQDSSCMQLENNPEF